MKSFKEKTTFLVFFTTCMLLSLNLFSCGEGNDDSSSKDKSEVKESEGKKPEGNNNEDDKERYGNLKERERLAISTFITQNNITIISESQFESQGSTTDISKNEFVLLENSGVYMQISNKGNGYVIQNGGSRIVTIRFKEQYILDPTIVTGNYDKPSVVDNMMVMRQDGDYIASFIEGMMYSTYGSAVPSGWLKPFPYIAFGGSVSADEEHAKVRLIVPHSQGHSTAQANVIPYFYEIIFQ